MRKYATAEHFQELFTGNASSLHLLSFLLTADQEIAEKCFVSGLEDCADGSHVFLEWAYAWARRIIIQNAIRMMTRGPDTGVQPPEPARKEGDPGLLRALEADRRFASILSLGKFERFVFVLSVLERHSDQDCSLLLKTSLAEIQKARKQATCRLGIAG